MIVHNEACIREHIQRQHIIEQWDHDWPNYCRECGASGEYYWPGSYDEPPDSGPCARCSENGLCPRCGRDQATRRIRIARRITDLIAAVRRRVFRPSHRLNPSNPILRRAVYAIHKLDNSLWAVMGWIQDAAGGDGPFIEHAAPCRFCGWNWGKNPDDYRPESWYGCNCFSWRMG